MARTRMPITAARPTRPWIIAPRSIEASICTATDIMTTAPAIPRSPAAMAGIFSAYCERTPAAITRDIITIIRAPRPWLSCSYGRFANIITGTASRATAPAIAKMPVAATASFSVSIKDMIAVIAVIISMIRPRAVTDMLSCSGSTAAKAITAMTIPPMAITKRFIAAPAAMIFAGSTSPMAVAIAAVAAISRTIDEIAPIKDSSGIVESNFSDSESIPIALAMSCIPTAIKGILPAPFAEESSDIKTMMLARPIARPIMAPPAAPRLFGSISERSMSAPARTNIALAMDMIRSAFTAVWNDSRAPVRPPRASLKVLFRSMFEAASAEFLNRVIRSTILYNRTRLNPARILSRSRLENILARVSITLPMPLPRDSRRG